MYDTREEHTQHMNFIEGRGLQPLGLLIFANLAITRS